MGELPRGKGGNGAGVHAAAQIGAHRHIAHELAAHGLPKQAVELLDQSRTVALRCFGEAEIPITGKPSGRCDLRADLEGAAGRKEVDALKKGALGQEILEGEIFDEGFGIKRGAEIRVAQEGLDLGSEEESVAAEHIIKRLDAVAVAREEEPPLLAVIKREGEHAVEPR